MLSARREFGNVAVVKERARDVWGSRWLEDFMQDVRYAIRTLLRAPAFTATAVAALALAAFTFVTTRRLACLLQMALSVGFRSSISLIPTTQATRPLALGLGGTGSD